MALAADRRDASTELPVNPDALADVGLTRVCIVAPFEPLRQGLVSALEDVEDIEVLGEARDLADLMSQPVFRDADVLVIDSDAVLGDNRAVYTKIDAWLPQLKVLFLGTREDESSIKPEDIPAYMRLDTVGFILKDGPTSRFVDAIRLVNAGTFVCETDLIRHILTRLTQWASYSDDSTRNEQQLSEREMEVLTYVAKGCSNREIAQELFLSEGTVKAHVSHIMGKLGAERRTDLVRHALSTGLIPMEDGSRNGASLRR